MLIKNLSHTEKPREKALIFGIEKLSDAELLAIFLKTGIKGTGVLNLSKQILQSCNGLRSFFKLNINELKKMKGLGTVKALEIIALQELNKRLSLSTTFKALNYEIEDIIKLVKQEFVENKREEFLIIGLNAESNIKLFKKLFLGATTHCAVEIKVIIEELITTESTKFYCFHNHPRNISTPSEEDILLTFSIDEVCAKLGLTFIEHGIYSDKNIYFIKRNQKYLFNCN